LASNDVIDTSLEMNYTTLVPVGTILAHNRASSVYDMAILVPGGVILVRDKLTFKAILVPNGANLVPNDNEFGVDSTTMVRDKARFVPDRAILVPKPQPQP
jgi:hypothetical protein